MSGWGWQGEWCQLPVQEPAVDHHATGKPRASHEPACQRQPWSPQCEGGRSRARAAPAEAGSELIGVRVELSAPVVAVCGEYDAGGQNSRFDGRADALAAPRIGEAGRIADEQRAIVHERPRGGRIQSVRVPVKPGGKVGGNAFLQFEVLAKRGDVPVERVAVLATQPDVEEVPLAERPAVALEVLAEVKFHAVFGHAAGPLLGRSHLELDFLGRDDAFGAFEACGSRQSYARALVQIGGDCWRIRASQYRELFLQSSNLRVAIHKHVEALLVEARQLVACTAIHQVESRMCRVLLDASARSHQGSHLTLTQEELANILGVQRSTIAVTSSALQRSGLIRSRRGSIDILSFEGLEAAACSCRRTIAFAHEEIQEAPDNMCEG